MLDAPNFINKLFKAFQVSSRMKILEGLFYSRHMTYQEMQDIRDVYKTMTPHIFKYSTNDRGIDPYFYNWDTIFSHTERLVWSDIRSIGIPFYPQYPVLNYFIDFADPIKKIAIEVDGKFHQNQVESDEKRQRDIEELGYKFIRIEGRYCYDGLESFVAKLTGSCVLIENEYDFIFNYESANERFDYNIGNHSHLIDIFTTKYSTGIIYDLMANVYEKN